MRPAGYDGWVLPPELSDSLALGVLQKSSGLVAGWAIRFEFQVGLQVRNHAGSVAFTFMDPGEKEVSLGQILVAGKRLCGTFFRVCNVAQSELDQAEEIFSTARPGVELEAPLDNRFRVSVVSLLTKNHAHQELRRREAAIGQIDGLL